MARPASSPSRSRRPVSSCGRTVTRSPYRAQFVEEGHGGAAAARRRPAASRLPRASAAATIGRMRGDADAAGDEQVAGAAGATGSGCAGRARRTAARPRRAGRGRTPEPPRPSGSRSTATRQPAASAGSPHSEYCRTRPAPQQQVDVGAGLHGGSHSPAGSGHDAVGDGLLATDRPSHATSVARPAVTMLAHRRRPWSSLRRRRPRRSGRRLGAGRGDPRDGPAASATSRRGRRPGARRRSGRRRSASVPAPSATRRPAAGATRTHRAAPVLRSGSSRRAASPPVSMLMLSSW